MPVCCRRNRASALVFGVLALSLLGLAPRPAAGDPVADKKAEAARIAGRVEELNGQLSVLAEQYNDAALQLETIKTQIADSQAKVDETKAAMVERRTQLQNYAVQAYVGGGEQGGLPLLLESSNSTESGQRRGYLAAAVGDRQQLIDELAAAEEDLGAQIALLGSAQAEAEAITSDLEARKASAAEAANEQEALLAKAKGELAALVSQEQQRQAAERARVAAARQSSRPASAGPSGPVVVPNGGAGAAIEEAKRQLGVRYTWGGSTPSSGFDCSGFTAWAWKAGGVSLPHSSRSQYSSTTHIPMSEIQPGDLIFYGRPLHHVALYVGGGQIIHAPSRGDYVRYDSVYYWDELVGAGRVS